jgi:hypothetical protein
MMMSIICMLLAVGGMVQRRLYVLARHRFLTNRECGDSRARVLVPRYFALGG